MPITQFLDGHSFDPETRRVMGVALEMARAALRLADRTDAITEILAERIIALTKEGMIDPNLLCEWALDDSGIRLSAPEPAPYRTQRASMRPPERPTMRYFPLQCRSIKATASR